MSHQHMMNRVIQHRVIDRHVRPTRIAKHHFHPFSHQTFPNNFCTFFLHCCSYVGHACSMTFKIRHAASMTYDSSTAPVSALVTNYESLSTPLEAVWGPNGGSALTRLAIHTPLKLTTSPSGAK